MNEWRAARGWWSVAVAVTVAVAGLTGVAGCGGPADDAGGDDLTPEAVLAGLEAAESGAGATQALPAVSAPRPAERAFAALLTAGPGGGAVRARLALVLDRRGATARYLLRARGDLIPGAAAMMHAAPGESGPEVWPLPGPDQAGRWAGSLTVTPALEAALAAGHLVVTAQLGGLELRGALLLPGETLFLARPVGDQVVPTPIDSVIRAVASVVLGVGQDRIRWRVRVEGALATALHVHRAEPGAQGPLVFAIPPLGPIVQGSQAVTPAQAADLLAGRWYLDVHTDAHELGELRGQLIRPDAAPGPVPGAP